MVKEAKASSKCPHPGCNQAVQPTDKRIQWFEDILKEMFKEYKVDDADDGDNEALTVYPAGGTLTVTVLTGESMAVPFSPSMEILWLKEKIRLSMGHEIGKQKLLYQEKELPDYTSNGSRARLSDYAIKPNSVVSLVILLFSVPEHFDHVVFDLYWGYPSSGCDFLDASCLLYNGLSYKTLADYRSRNPVSAVNHSGDVMDHVRKIGHHTIQVKLKQMPTDVTHLFFTLSAWSSPNISRYPNPSLKFYQADNPKKDLCKTTFTHAAYSQAVIMCSVSRGTHGKWEIFESGKLTAGNAANYGPIMSTVQSLIAKGF